MVGDVDLRELFEDFGGESGREGLVGVGGRGGVVGGDVDGVVAGERC